MSVTNNSWSRSNQLVKISYTKHSVRNVQLDYPFLLYGVNFVLEKYSPKPQRSTYHLDVCVWNPRSGMCPSCPKTTKTHYNLLSLHNTTHPSRFIRPRGIKTSRLKHALKVVPKEATQKAHPNTNLWPDLSQPSTRKPSPLPPPSSTLQTHPADPAKNQLGSNNSLRYQNYNVLPTPSVAY